MISEADASDTQTTSAITRSFGGSDTARHSTGGVKGQVSRVAFPEERSSSSNSDDKVSGHVVFAGMKLCRQCEQVFLRHQQSLRNYGKARETAGAVSISSHFIPPIRSPNSCLNDDEAPPWSIVVRPQDLRRLRNQPSRRVSGPQPIRRGEEHGDRRRSCWRPRTRPDQCRRRVLRRRLCQAGGRPEENGRRVGFIRSPQVLKSLRSGHSATRVLEG